MVSPAEMFGRGPTIVHDETLKRFQTEDGKYYVQYQYSSSKVMEIVIASSPGEVIDALKDATYKYARDNNLTVTPTDLYNSGQPLGKIQRPHAASVLGNNK